VIERARFLARRKDCRATDVIDLNDWSAEDGNFHFGSKAPARCTASNGCNSSVADARASKLVDPS